MISDKELQIQSILEKIGCIQFPGHRCVLKTIEEVLGDETEILPYYPEYFAVKCDDIIFIFKIAEKYSIGITYAYYIFEDVAIRNNIL